MYRKQILKIQILTLRMDMILMKIYSKSLPKESMIRTKILLCRRSIDFPHLKWYLKCLLFLTPLHDQFRTILKVLNWSTWIIHLRMTICLLLINRLRLSNDHFEFMFLRKSTNESFKFLDMMILSIKEEERLYQQ